jgi:hypothetical protein
MGGTLWQQLVPQRVLASAQVDLAQLAAPKVAAPEPELGHFVWLLKRSPLPRPKIVHSIYRRAANPCA